MSPLLDEILNFIISTPQLEQIAEFKISDQLDDRLHHLLELNSRSRLSEDERVKLDEFLRMGHFLTMMKAKARLKLTEKVTETVQEA